MEPIATAPWQRRISGRALIQSAGSGAAVIWVILGALGVPLWLCACAILRLVFPNRSAEGERSRSPPSAGTAPAF